MRDRRLSYNGHIYASRRGENLQEEERVFNTFHTLLKDRTIQAKWEKILEKHLNSDDNKMRWKMQEIFWKERQGNSPPELAITYWKHAKKFLEEEFLWVQLVIVYENEQIDAAIFAETKDGTPYEKHYHNFREKDVRDPEKMIFDLSTYM